ncbi:MAG TPA: alpha/beta hydrolase [Solirubrobacterales bacterium]
MKVSEKVTAPDYGNPNPDWLAIDWSKHRHRVELPGAEVNYVEMGAGKPVVFIHGISGSWQNWLENLPHISRTHRAIALDLPGFGGSPMPSWPIGMQAYGRLIHDFCEKIGVDRGAAVVGNSMGGLIATEAAIAGPDRFDRLILVSAAGLINTWRPRERGIATALAWDTGGPHVARLGSMLVRRRGTRYLTFRCFVRYPNQLRPELLWEQLQSGVPCPGFSDALGSAIAYDARHRLAEIETPTLIVWGDADWVIPVQAGYSYKRRIPGARLEIFENTGHVPQLERPARFNNLLDEFLS